MQLLGLNGAVQGVAQLAAPTVGTAAAWFVTQGTAITTTAGAQMQNYSDVYRCYCSQAGDRNVCA